MVVRLLSPRKQWKGWKHTTLDSWRFQSTWLTRFLCFHSNRSASSFHSLHYRLQDFFLLSWSSGDTASAEWQWGGKNPPFTRVVQLPSLATEKEIIIYFMRWARDEGRSPPVTRKKDFYIILFFITSVNLVYLHVSPKVTTSLFLVV